MEQKPLVLIVEGIDHIGKTTLIKRLMENQLSQYSKDTGKLIYYRDLIQLNTISKILKHTTPEFLDKKHDGILCGILNMLEAFKNQNVSFVFDRLHLSGAAYGWALRKNLEPREFNKAFEKLLIDKFSNWYDIKLLTIVVDGKPSDEDEVVNASQLKLVNSYFEKLFKSSILPKQKIVVKMHEGISDIFDAKNLDMISLFLNAKM